MKQTIVYPWIKRMARGNELKYSLRSVEKHFIGFVEVWLVGDAPDWYTGNYLPVSEYDSRLTLPRQDRAKKLWRVVEEPAVADEFLWMMDDIYFLNRVDLTFFRRPRICGRMAPELLKQWLPESEWGRQKKLTWEALAESGRPLLDFATHLPHVYEKTKLRALYKQYNLWDAPYVDDLLYGNEFLTDPYEASPAETILYRETRRPALSGLKRRIERSGCRVLNHVDQSYTSAIERFLAERFPAPSRWEKGPR